MSTLVALSVRFFAAPIVGMDAPHSYGIQTPSLFSLNGFE